MLATIAGSLLCPTFITKFTAGGFSIALFVITCRPIAAITTEVPSVAPFFLAISSSHAPPPLILSIALCFKKSILLCNNDWCGRIGVWVSAAFLLNGNGLLSVWGGGALLIAVISLLQMIWRAPKIVIAFETDDREDFLYLSCWFWNIPIYKGLLNILRVRREQAPDVTAEFEIREQETRKVICPLTPVKIRIQRGVMAERISLPASFTPAMFAIVGVARNSQEVRVYKEQKQILPLGAYTARVKLLVGPKLLRAEHNFTVEDRFPFARWESIRVGRKVDN